MFGNRIRFYFNRSDENYHGPNHTPKTNTASLVRMASYAKCWSLYLYGPKGGWVRFEVCFPKWLGPWPYSSNITSRDV